MHCSLYTVLVMIDIAIEAVQKAGTHALSYFNKQLKIEYKKDSSPVTRADRETEQIIRKIISKAYPNHGFIGEEFGKTNPNAQYVWVIDPVDGTRGFTRGIPFWSTLLALLKDGKPIIGISYSPATDEFFLARHNKGTFLNGKRIKVSKVSKIKDAFIAHGTISHFEKDKKVKGILDIAHVAYGRYGYGWELGFRLFLKGHVDAVLDTGGIYDFAAPSILAEEAGGKFTDFSGKYNLSSGSAILSNGLLHSQVIKLLNSN